MFPRFLPLVATALAISAPAFAQDPPDLAGVGKDHFDQQCSFCHDGVSGPDLKGVSGRKIGSTDFSFSEALKAKGQTETWTDANLDAFLKDSAAFAPGTVMAVAVPDDAQRAAIIAYLKSLK